MCVPTAALTVVLLERDAVFPAVMRAVNLCTPLCRSSVTALAVGLCRLLRSLRRLYVALSAYLRGVRALVAISSPQAL